MRPSPSETFRSPGALICFFLTAFIGLFADLWTKALAVEHLKDTHRVVEFISGWLQFEYTENHGAVFGLGQGQRILFLVVSVGALLFLVWLFAQSGKQRFYQFILGMLLAGVMGNMYDRVYYGYVRDMIHALPGWHWPEWVVNLLPASWQPAPGMGLAVFPWIFNIADSLLVVGVILMVAYSFVHRAPPDAEAEAESVPPKRAFEPVPAKESQRT